MPWVNKPASGYAKAIPPEPAASGYVSDPPAQSQHTAFARKSLMPESLTVTSRRGILTVRRTPHPKLSLPLSDPHTKKPTLTLSSPPLPLRPPRLKPDTRQRQWTHLIRP